MYILGIQHLQFQTCTYILYIWGPGPNTYNQSLNFCATQAVEKKQPLQVKGVFVYRTIADIFQVPNCFSVLVGSSVWLFPIGRLDSTR